MNCSPEKIREEMAKTRHDLSGSIDALQERIQTHPVAEAGLAAARQQLERKAERTLAQLPGRVRSAGSSITGTLQQHPVAVLALGLGLSLLLAQRHQNRD